MKKAALFFLLCILFTALFSFTCLASEVSYSSDSGSLIEDYLSDFSIIIPKDSEIDIKDTDTLYDTVGFGYVINELYNALSGSQSKTYEFLILSLALSLFVALSYTFGGSAVGRGAGAVALGVITVFLLPSISFAVKCLADASEFFSYAVPIIISVTVAGGGVAQAGAQSLALTISLSLIGDGVVKLLLPVSVFLIALSLLSSLSGTDALNISKNARSFFLWGMGILTALFSGAVGLQSILSGARDSMSIRTARYAISNIIPIVGSSVSGALSTLGGALSYVKDTLGIGTVAVLLSLLLPTLITLLIYRFIVSVSASLIKMISGVSQNAFSSFLMAFDTLIASYAFSSLIYIIETVIFIKSGVAIL